MFKRMAILLPLAHLALSLSSGAIISIDDRKPPGSVPDVYTDIDGATVVLTDTEVALVLLVPSGPFGPIPAGVRSVILLNQPGDLEGPGPSDLAILTVSDPFPDENGETQLIQLFFQSDNAPGFAENIVAVLPTAATLFETGEMQDVSAVLNTLPWLTILLGSNVHLPVPEPGTWILGATGLLAAGAFKRFRRN